MKIDPNSPAFPQSVNVSTQPGHYTNVTAHPGLPIRLHLAAEMMQAILSTSIHSIKGTGPGDMLSGEPINPGGAPVNEHGDLSPYDLTLRWLPVTSLALADALLAEYNKEPKP